MAIPNSPDSAGAAVRGNDGIAPAALGLIEIGIRLPGQLLQRLARTRMGMQADAGSDPRIAPATAASVRALPMA